ncbi:hypothetical protein CH293_26220 [Rhodococcus sp. 14-2470-1b]|uniref:hypothetical protein n=1 Tax=Rhodococcus sp. 14-2470-1b TaxID=2023149 RepID=UPI000B9A5B88|nr:hypothetical protein [Rhodococcus sp. 14-2470-1b]OZF42582.1 hypothetical protein CH293_26220 [Rhodococcus sp. 14-2470-1b]
MILTDRIAHGVAAGDVTVAYRRWMDTRGIKAGSTLRTVAGIVRIDRVDRVDLEQLEASAAGYNSRAELVSTLRGDETVPLWRITLRWIGPDPREELASNAILTAAEIDEISTVLKKLDARHHWAEPTLYRLAEQPGMTAAQLAEGLPIGKEPLKRRIRTLKEHGLTRSLPSGYRLSPRGHAYLDATDPKRQ